MVALAGRRIDAADSTVERFPLDCIAIVAERLRDELQHLRASTLICSAANGADLTALHVARELGMHRRIVLPFSIAKFRDVSVTDRPGGELWGWIFDEIIEEAAASGSLTLLDGSPSDNGNAFAAASARIIDDAVALSAEFGAPVSGIAVWDGTSRGKDDMTASFVERMHAHGLPVHTVPSGR